MTATPLIVGLDVDDVVLSLIDEWLRRYNIRRSDNLLPEDIRGWGIGEQATKMDPSLFYSILDEPDLYEHITPVPGARKMVVELLAQGHRVVYVSSCHGTTMGQKVACLLRYGFLTPKNAQRDFIAANDKSLVTGVDVLFDDHVKNVEAFPKASFLVNVPHNQGIACSKPRVDLWEIPDIVRVLAESPYRI